MISKKSYIKQIIFSIMIVMLIFNFNIVSYAVGLNINVDEEENNKTNEEINIESKQVNNANLVINVEYIYNSGNNTITAIMHSNNELKDTKPSWELSADKLSYTKTFGANDIYDTQVEDTNGNITTVTIEITQIIPTITVEYIKNDNNTVTAIMHSNSKLRDTKPSWTLSADGLSYTKTFGANDDYTTDVEDIYGNVVTVRITITGIDTQEPFTITMEYKKNDDNTVTVIMHSNKELKDTKPSWTLSEDKLSYTKTFGANDIYDTQVEDTNGNITTVTIEITQIIPTITVEYIKNDNNTVTAIMHSNSKLKDTKPSWTLSADGLSYTKIFGANEDYTTQVEDLYGNVITVRITITQIISQDFFSITMEYKKNSDNTVTAIMHSNRELKNTKPSWTLSADKLSYTKIFGANEDYTTQVEDIYGNVTTVRITITQIVSQDPFDVTIEYKKNDDNTVTAIMHSNRELKNTKPSWTLSEDKLSYTKTFGANDIYTTDVEDIYGNVTTVTIEVTQIDDKGPEITLEYIYNADGTTTVIMHSNEVLAHTKPSWTLSEDKLNYTKTFGADDEYATAVEDIYGNVAWVKIRISTKNYQYSNAGFIVTVKYLYDSNEKVTVKLVSNRPLKSTKPSWTLSEDQMVYTRVFTNNDIYTTSVEDIYGNQLTVSILVDFFKNTHRGIDVSEYQKFIDWRTVKNSGIDFAIIRVGYRGYGNGKIVEDRFFDNNIQEATKAGMDIGFYFYSQAISVEEAVQEAQFTLQLLSKYNVPITYPIAIDTERTPNGNGRADGISKELRTEVVRAFCNEIQRAGYKTMIYANKNWLLNDLNITSLNYDVWLAHYTDATDYPYPYTIWQYTSTGSVNGIVGNVDMNIGYKKY